MLVQGFLAVGGLLHVFLLCMRSSALIFPQLNRCTDRCIFLISHKSVAPSATRVRNILSSVFLLLFAQKYLSLFSNAEEVLV